MQSVTEMICTLVLSVISDCWILLELLDFCVQYRQYKLLA